MESETQSPKKKKKHPALTTLGILGVFLLVVLVAAYFLPSVVLRYVFSRIETESGITITFDKAYFYLADGSFLSIEGLTVKRQNHHSSNFDLKVASVRIPAMFPADFYSPVLLVTELRGTVERVGVEPLNVNEGGEKDDHKKESASDNTSISALMLIDSEVEFIDRTLEKPFRVTIEIKNFAAILDNRVSLFAPYSCLGEGNISSAKFGIIRNEDKPRIAFSEVPFGLLAPYVPVLDDIFVSGGMNILVDDLSDEAQKRMHVSITLQQDCKIKPANEILAPTIQVALQQLDQSSMPELRNLKEKIERIKTSAESVRGRLGEVASIVDRLSVLAPREVRDEYEKIKSQYDKAMGAYDEWNGKLETLVWELDQVKVRIIGDTFQAFINSGIPIEIMLQEVNGEWQYDGYAIVIDLIKKNYETIIAAQYQKRIQEIRDAVDRLLVP